MTTWVAPATAVNGGLTAAQLNATRDNLTFLKGALDIISGSTSADTGNTMLLDITRASASDTSFKTHVAADGYNRFVIAANGDMTWGSGAATGDTTLKRSTVGTLRTDGILSLYNTYTSNTLTSTQAGDGNMRFAMLGDGTMRWGDGTSAYDTVLYRGAANTLQTDDSLTLNGIVTLNMNNGLSLNGNGFIVLTEITEPTAPATNLARLFCVDNGSGKTSLRVRFATGATATLATEP